MLMTTSGNPPQMTQGSTSESDKKEEVCKHISNLILPEHRENALIELCKHRESMPDMALLLWNSFGAVCALIQEVCSIYPYMNPPTLTVQQSNRVCNALALLQCLASHQETRREFLEACIPQYLYSFLHSQSRTRQYEYLRLTSLGVIGALVKSDESDVIKFLLSTEMIPLCLKIMETGSELSKTVATFILQKILNDETGLVYMCQKVERLKQVNTMLTQVVNSLSQEPSPRLLKHVVRCYGRLADNPVACENLRMQLPRQLFEDEILTHMGNDSVSLQLLEKIRRSYDPSGPLQQQGASATNAAGASSVSSNVPPSGNQQNFTTMMAARINNGPQVARAVGTSAGSIPGGPASGYSQQQQALGP